MRLYRHASGCDNSSACAWCGRAFAHYGHGDVRNDVHYEDLDVVRGMDQNYEYYCVPCAELFLRVPADAGATLRALRG